MTITETESGQPYQAAEAIVAILVLAAGASIAGGFALASRPHHTWAWILAGGMEAVGFITAAAVVYLLREIAINTHRLAGGVR